MEYHSAVANYNVSTSIKCMHVQWMAGSGCVVHGTKSATTIY